MRQSSTSATRQRLTDFLNDPLSQGLLTGALTLIPARNYPTWLRRGLIWAPPIAGGAGAAYLVMNPKMRRKIAAKVAVAQYSPSTPDSLRPPEPPAAFRTKGPSRTAALIAAGTAVGGVFSLATAASFWADEKIDQGLRRINVPFPRAVMGLAAGGVTWWSLKRDQDAAAESKH
ncbi:hypothetical protein GCM10023190_13700 [Enteractinococcus fodinae]|uniref:DUF3180 domain-containing protein n=1 Tax=Enteractinococcus fodinae TaxID=684663 RepID=A0ABU2AXS3_9MICC|nr:hypothetical protein [Enteractinococcus fodinae]MDR7346154.1 hypothetical protein [Enteractinococcus fodinae]